MNFEQRLERYMAKTPVIPSSAYVAPCCSLIGDVTLGDDCSIWYNSVLRADINSINIGDGTNIQDGSVVHLADDLGVTVGEYVTVGHKAMLHACSIGNETLVGMGAIILDGAEIGSRCIIGAGALVTQHKKIPDGSMVMGTPAKIVRQLDLEEQKSIRHWAEKYVALSKYYLAGKQGTVIR